jgi:hypothetical protein
MRLSILLVLFFLCLGKCFAMPGDSTIIGKSKRGMRYGAWRYYDTHQHIIKVEKYRRGKLVQTYIFNSDGRVSERINRKGHVTKLRACGC